MTVTMLKGKIHRATVVKQAELKLCRKHHS